MTVISAPARAIGAVATIAVLAATLTQPVAAQVVPLPGTGLDVARAASAQRQVPNLAGKVLTVLGPVDPSTIGPTLMHEHIFINFQSPRPRPQRGNVSGPFEDPLTLDNAYAVRYGRGGARGTDFLGNFDVMYKEVMDYKTFGGQAIVDVSSIGLGRDPMGLVRMANATGLSIVMGASWYTKQYHPLDMDQRTVEQLTDEIVRDVTVGVQGTTVRSGIIGEIGIDGGPLTPNELKVIRASARAGRITGAPITFHAGGVNEERLTTIETSLSEGITPQQIIMGHSGALTPNMPLLRRMFEKGVYIQIDWLGVATGPDGILGNRSDRTIASAIVEMIRWGYADRILLSHDICTKPQLKEYGGTGFSYILEYFVPELRRQGVSEENIRRIVVENPRRALTFRAPKP